MRIASLLPSATEILFAIGAGDDVVAVTHECDFPPEARTRPILTSSALVHDGTAVEIDRHVRKNLHEGSSLYTLDSARLEELKPDLIVTQELCKVCAVSYEIVDRAARKLKSDPRIISLEPSTLEDVYATIGFLGEATGHVDGARSLVGKLRSREQHLRDEVAQALAQHEERPRVLLLEWTDPPMSAGHWSPGLVELAGGTPVLGHPGVNSQTLAWPTIAKADPDAVVVAPCGFDLERTRGAVHEIERNDTWRNLRAHKMHEVYLMDGNAYLNRPGPRLLDTAEIIATMLHEDEIDVPILDPHAWEPLHG